jgi:hypothetical protein
MGYLRAMTVDPEQPGCYHCVRRCDRRVRLCGAFAVTGRCLDYRLAGSSVGS